MLPRPTLHLISGLPGSGKTTYASRLAAKTGGVVFSLDYWLITAYGQYGLSRQHPEEHVRRVLACRELIWTAAAELLRRSADVILDDGFFFREHRMRFIQLAARLGAGAKVHHVQAPLDVLRERLDRRNRQLPPYNFRIRTEALEAFRGQFEAPSGDEGAELVLVGA